MSVPTLLLLEDGSAFEGMGLGVEGATFGEVVFNTSMTGYQEILTDPSYAGQIVMMTQPHIGNYGVNSRDNESDSIQARGLVVRELSEIPSNFQSESTLQDWLQESSVPVIWGIDTRNITRRIRNQGAMMGAIIVGARLNEASQWHQRLSEQAAYGSLDYVSEVSVRQPREVRLSEDDRIIAGAAEGTGHVVVVDFGVKHSILRNLLKRDLRVTLVPNQIDLDELTQLNPDGVLLSNGPGDPILLDERHALVREIAERWPTWGICLGHQILARAFGGATYKLPFGHRGPNQPVQYLPTGRVEMTSQNHGYAVSPQLPDCLKPTHINLNDETIEGFRHLELPIEAVQFHPEAGPGPHDAENFFDRFKSALDV